MRHILFILIPLLLFSQTKHFTEERYIDAIDKNITLDGDITFSGNSVTVIYHSKPEKKIFYSPSKLELFIGDKPEPVQEEAKEYIAIMLGLFEMLNAKDNTSLLEHFKVHRKFNERELTPKGTLESIITTIKLYENGNAIERIVIYFRNSDILTITARD